MKVGVYRNSFRSGSNETEEIRNLIIQTHKEHPEYNVKTLSMVCFCGERAVERCLQIDRKNYDPDDTDCSWQQVYRNNRVEIE